MSRLLLILDARGAIKPIRSLEPSAPSPNPTAQTVMLQEFVRDERLYVRHLESVHDFRDKIVALGIAFSSTTEPAEAAFASARLLLSYQRRFLLRVEVLLASLADREDWLNLLSTLFSNWRRATSRLYTGLVAVERRAKVAIRAFMNQPPPSRHVKEWPEDIQTSAFDTLSALGLPYQRLMAYQAFLEVRQSRQRYFSI